MSYLQISGLKISYGDKVVLHNIDLAVEQGEMIALLGPSGCGKTTLLNALCGFIPVQSGEMAIASRTITHLAPEQRNITMVFQSYALWPHLTLRENVAFGLEMRAVKKADVRKRALRALEMVKLADRANSKPNELSGGQQQRVALARALVIEPQCLLLDEPLSNLDAKLRLEMRTEIRRICKGAGLTAIYVTHDQKEALSIADRLAILDQGRLLQIGTPQEVYVRPASRFVAQFIGETTFVEGRVKASRNGQIEVETAAGRWISAAGGAFAAGEAVWLSVRPEAVQMHAERTDEPNVFPAHMHGTVYLGEVAQHFADLAGGITLKSLETRPRRVARDGERAETRIYVDPADVQVLRE